MMTATTYTTPLRQRLIEQMQIANLADTTRECYVREIRRLAEHYGQSPDRLDAEQIRAWIMILIERGLSTASVNVTIPFVRNESVDADARIRLRTVLSEHDRVLIPDIGEARSVVVGQAVGRGQNPPRRDDRAAAGQSPAIGRRTDHPHLPGPVVDTCRLCTDNFRLRPALRVLAVEGLPGERLGRDEHRQSRRYTNRPNHRTTSY